MSLSCYLRHSSAVFPCLALRHSDPPQQELWIGVKSQGGHPLVLLDSAYDLPIAGL